MHAAQSTAPLVPKFHFGTPSFAKLSFVTPRLRAAEVQLPPHLR